MGLTIPAQRLGPQDGWIATVTRDRVRCSSAWLYAGHSLAELLGKRDNDPLRPADIG
jgi:hypothetical protein